MTTRHVPILVKPIVEGLLEPFRRLPENAEPHWLVDATLGGGGHCSQFLEAFASDPALAKHRVLALDQDPQAIARGKVRFEKELSSGKLEIIQCRFGEASEWVQGRPVLGLLADLGFSSDQMDDPGRGLSFQSDGPLDMRLNPPFGTSCRDLLETLSQDELENILLEFGEERFSRRIAGAIISARSENKLPETPRELARIVVHAIPPSARHGRIHAATRTFQALRIAVNEEISQLDRLLEHVIMRIKPGGRIAILSFHSIEDRRVKVRFRNSDLFEPLTKKPIQASDEEVRLNPRSRSAKLRIAEKTA